MLMAPFLCGRGGREFTFGGKIPVAIFRKGV